MSGDVAMHPFHGIGSGERPVPRQQFVERDAERIEVASRIDRAIHSPGLFRSHVGKCSGNELRKFGGLMLASKARGDAKSHQPNMTRRGIQQNVRRLHILVYQIPLVQPGERDCQTNGAAEELTHLHRSRTDDIERPATRILKHQRRPRVVL